MFLLNKILLATEGFRNKFPGTIRQNKKKAPGEILTLFSNYSTFCGVSAMPTTDHWLINYFDHFQLAKGCTKDPMLVKISLKLCYNFIAKSILLHCKSIFITLKSVLYSVTESSSGLCSHGSEAFAP